MDNNQLEYNDKASEKNKLPILIFLDNLTDPRNVGMIFRLADAFAIEEIYLGGYTPFPPNVKLKRTARGTDRYIKFRKVSDSIEALQSIKKEGYTLISLEITKQSKDIKFYDFSKLNKICIIAGSEEKGVSEKILNITDETIHIEMMGIGLSMNVANSLAIFLYESSKHLIKKNNVIFKSVLKKI